MVSPWKILSCRLSPAFALAKSNPQLSIMRRMLAPVEMALERGSVVLVKADGYFSYKVTMCPALRRAMAAERPPACVQFIRSCCGQLAFTYTCAYYSDFQWLTGLCH